MAGLLGQALAGALMGGGQAVQHNAQSRIEQKRQEALAEVKHRYRMAQQDDQQQFTRGENQRTREFNRSERLEGQDFTAGQNQLTREQQRELALLRERGANSRAAMGRNDWEVMQANDGSLVRINTRSGDIEPMDAGDMRFGGESWTERDQAYVESLQSEMESLQEIAKTGMLSEEQKARMQAIPQEMRTYAQGIDSGSETLSAYEQWRQGQQGSTGGGSGGPPPLIARPGAQGSGGGQSGQEGGTTASDYMAERERQQAEAERNREADARVSEMTDEAKRIAGRLTIPDRFSGGFQRGGLLNRANGGGIDTQAERQAAQQVLVEVAAQHDTERDPDRKAQLKEAMDALLEAGVTLPNQR
ncbi:hypothetical protein ACGTNG_12495 [Halomonas sp. 1390]|uniref:hypothetical protein n=1 Tax=Halomonas sp. B23F22_3 TaxID=3459516 RepID=UPI00373DF820